MHVHLRERAFDAEIFKSEQEIVVEQSCAGKDIGLVNFADEFENDAAVRQCVDAEIDRFDLEHVGVLVKYFLQEIWYLALELSEVGTVRNGDLASCARRLVRTV